MALEDADLIARALVNRDTHAFGELVKRHQSLVRNLLRKLLRGDDARADDLAQETFLKAHRHLGQFGQRAQFSTWLCGIAYNEFRVWARGNRDHASLEEVVYEPSVVPAQTAHDFRQDLNQAMKFLSLEERTAVVCCAVQGMSHSEAVEVLGWPLGTVKTHLSRGKEKLRNLLAEWANTPKL